MIPTRPEHFTTDWLAEKIGAPAGSLAGFDAKAIGTGQMCDSFRLTLDWNGYDGPRTIVAKCPSANEASRAIAKAIHNYTLEIRWYQDLADIIPVSCPRCYHAEIDENETDFALLLGDMAPADQGDQLAGAGLAQIEAAIAEAAKLHAPYWDSEKLEDYDWLGFGKGNKEVVRGLLPQLYVGFRERYTGRLTEDILKMGDTLIGNIDAYLDYNPVRTIVHGDFRVDNLLFHPETGAVTVVDWQTVGIGTGAADIAYLIGTSIADPDERASHEKRLVENYVAQLNAAGAETDPETCWQNYRRNAFSGFIMAVFASMNVERTERGDEMFAVMAERPARQVLDLDSLELL